jgi:hypothetical protein
MEFDPMSMTAKVLYLSESCGGMRQSPSAAGTATNKLAGLFSTEIFSSSFLSALPHPDKPRFVLKYACAWSCILAVDADNASHTAAMTSGDAAFSRHRYRWIDRVTQIL